MKPLPIEEETKLHLPLPCVSCGTKEDVKSFRMVTSAGATSGHYIIRYCQRCAVQAAQVLIRSWENVLL